MSPFLKTLLRVLGLALLGLWGQEAEAALNPGTVYLVVGSDTAIWDGLDLARYRCHFKPDLYTSPTQNAHKVMDPQFRGRFTDSFGTPLKLTWWSLVGGINRPSDNPDTPFPGLMPLHLLKKYHGDRMQVLGDEQAIHYHTFFWSDYDHDGKFWWNESKTFLECESDFDVALAQSFLEEGLFPVSFRGGWHYMDDAWQRRLNELLPFSLHCASPIRSTDAVEPLENHYDWSKAPLAFVPFHPSTTNYQVPGDGAGWNVRSIKLPSLTQTIVNGLFAEAAKGNDQVACFWAHLPETDFLTNLAKVDLLAHVASTNYPGVRFRYCTAVEAMQRWMKTDDTRPPALNVREEVEGDSVRLLIQVDEPIFQPQPVVALKDIWQRYQILKPEPAGALQWRILLPVPRSEIAKVGVAVVDPSGNLATRILRHVQDDVYVDNLDPGFHELDGAWETSQQASWDTDSRRAVITPDRPARARWELPITLSGDFALWVQVPEPISDGASLAYSLYSRGVKRFTRTLSSPSPSNQWIYLGASPLEAGSSTWLELEATTRSEAGAVVFADVIRLSALPVSDDFIPRPRIDPGTHAATLSWKTKNPSSALIEIGTTPDLGGVRITNPAPATFHLVTVRDLAPGTTYFFRISTPGIEPAHCYPCGWDAKGSNSFATLPVLTNATLLSLSNVWSYSAQNLDGVAWHSAGYDDHLWSRGPGLLWVDTRAGGPNTAVKGRVTEMPHDPADNFPFTTYYFRTHFYLPGDPAFATLTLTNFLDDGAVYYLNGAEVRRENMPPYPAPITHATLSEAFSCGGDATCPVVFSLDGPGSSLKQGDNLLAVEVHNYSARSADITFGASITAQMGLAVDRHLYGQWEGSELVLYWNETNLVLRATSDLKDPAQWNSVAGGGGTSPYRIEGAAMQTQRFFRLESGKQ